MSLLVTPHGTAPASSTGKRSTRVLVNPQVFLELAFDGESAGRVVIELYADSVPLTAENFRCLCTGEKGRGNSGKRLTYLGSIFHRVVRGFVCVGGDTTLGNGTGGESIYGDSFDDEKSEATHDGPGILSMANSGPNTNGSQFFISLNALPHLDGKNVVFGKIISGYEHVEKVEECGSEEGTVSKRITIWDCGEVEQKGKAVKRVKLAQAPIVQVLHILRKHKGCKKPTSWKGEAITCTKEEAAKFLVGLRKELTDSGGGPTAQRKMFEKLAEGTSDDKSAKKGGDIGPFERDMMPKPFADASFALKVDELSDVVSDKHGEHLIFRIS